MRQCTARWQHGTAPAAAPLVLHALPPRARTHRGADGDVDLAAGARADLAVRRLLGALLHGHLQRGRGERVQRRWATGTWAVEAGDGPCRPAAAAAALQACTHAASAALRQHPHLGTRAPWPSLGCKGAAGERERWRRSLRGPRQAAAAGGVPNAGPADRRIGGRNASGIRAGADKRGTSRGQEGVAGESLRT